MTEKICSKCGTKLSYYLDTGYLGCPECYHAFENEIEATLEKVQGETVNKGKKPFTNSADRKLIEKYNQLIAEKETACIEGRFTEMAELSNQISELYNELQIRGLR